jgi:hypothetical protein
MRVTFPVIPDVGEFDKFLRRLLYRKTGEREGWLTYEGPFEFGVARQNLCLNTSSFTSFVRAVKVEGGYKGTRGDMLLVEPYRTVPLRVRISEDYLELLRKVSERLGRKVSEHARISLLDTIRRALELIDWPEKELPKAKSVPAYEETYPIGRARLLFRISSEQYGLLKKIAELGGQNPSQYVRMCLESGLPKEAMVLGLLGGTSVLPKQTISNITNKI